MGAVEDVRIKSVEAIPVSVDIDVPYKSSLGLRGRSDFVIVRIQSSDGEEGYGEASLEPLWPEGETQASVAFVVEKILGRQLIGDNCFDLERIHQKMHKLIAGNLYAKAAIDIAVHDFIGKHLGIPLSCYLGGLLCREVEVKFNIPMGSADETAELSKFAAKNGYRVLKLKVGQDIRKDVANLEAIRSSVGDSVPVGIDANGAWNTKQAVTNIRKMEAYDLYFVEQPVARWDLDGLAYVRRMVNTPVMADESIYTLHDAVELVRIGAADMFSVYVGKAGGIHEARKILAVAQGAGVECTMGSNIELGVGNAAKLHIAASHSAVSVPSDIPVWFYKEDIITPKLEVVGGKIRVPEGKGLGVRVDERKLERYSVSTS